MYTTEEKNSFKRQARFLRGLAAIVKAYNETDGFKIDMEWLADDLEAAAREAEQEAKTA